MWARKYKDYPPDSTLVKQQVEPSHGITGCEMHDIIGWGESYHIERKKKKVGFFKWLWQKITKKTHA